jgi:hypothetical protein
MIFELPQEGINDHNNSYHSVVCNQSVLSTTMLLEGPFLLKPSPSQHNRVQIFYTDRELPRVKRRLYHNAPPTTTLSTAVLRNRSSSLSSDGLPQIKRRRLPPTPLHRDQAVEDSIAQAFVPPSQDYRKTAEFWQRIARTQKQQIHNHEMDARQLRRRLWELEEQVVWLAGGGRGGGGREPLVQPHSSTSTAQPISPSTHHTERPPSYIIMQPRKCCFYLTDGEGLSEDEYDDHEECGHCCLEEELEEEETKENTSSSGGDNTGAAQLFRVKQDARDDDAQG